MQNRLLSLLIIYSLTAGGISHAAEDDVYVDLSVLDNIPQDSIGFVASQPLFPEIKAAPQTATKSVELKVNNKAVKIVKPQPSKPKPPVEEKNLKNEENIQINPQDITVSNEVSKPILEIIAPVEPEKISEPENILPKQVQDQEQKVDEPVSTEETSVPTILSAKISEESVVKEKSIDFAPREIYSISFMADSAELSQEALQRLEKVAKVFSVDRKKKIAIRAYNYENGQESFHKKRISLSRATEVRSFFLAQGFKNFSIKIINTTTDNDYKDTVEIEELN